MHVDLMHFLSLTGALCSTLDTDENRQHQLPPKPPLRKHCILLKNLNATISQMSATFENRAVQGATITTLQGNTTTNPASEHINPNIIPPGTKRCQHQIFLVAVSGITSRSLSHPRL